MTKKKGSFGMLGKHHSVEWRKNHSKIMLNMNYSNEKKEQMSKAISKGLIGKKFSKSHKENISKVMKKLWQNQSYSKHMRAVHKGQIPASAGKTPSLETRIKISKSLSGRKRPDLSKKMKLLWKKGIFTKERNDKIGKASKKLWKDPAFREKTIRAMLKAVAIRPTTPEKMLIGLLKEKKLMYNYVGDGSFIISGKCPDFVNCNGQKKIIEVFGTYWHGKQKTGRTKEQEEKFRINHFKKVGWKTLIIWENEFENLELVSKKIIDFDKKEALA